MALLRRSLPVAATAALVLAACGPSAGQVKAARDARYDGSRDEVFLAVIDEVAKDHKIAKSDPDQAALLTQGRWYEADGTYEDKAMGSDDAVMAGDGSVFVGFLVRVTGDEPPYQVIVEPEVDQIRLGFSAPYHMKPGDPEMPGWVKSKVDDFQIALHQRLKGRLVSPPGVTRPTS